MAFEKGRKFSTGTSVHRKRQMSTLVEKEGHFGPALTVCLLAFMSSHWKERRVLGRWILSVPSWAWLSPQLAVRKHCEMPPCPFQHLTSYFGIPH
jgi:hypothetical protein